MSINLFMLLVLNMQVNAIIIIMIIGVLTQKLTKIFYLTSVEFRIALADLLSVLTII